MPDDFPSCDTPFLESHNHEKPHCDCYIDEDAVLDTALDPSYKCARPYTCMHEQSQVALLRNDGQDNSGLEMSSDYDMPGWSISLIVICLVTISTLFFTLAMPRIVTIKTPALVKASKNSIGRMTLVSIKEDINETSSFHQFIGLFFITWGEYRPGVINVLRVVEVCGLGMLTGLLFFDVGNNSSATGFGEKTSLLFFSTTLWSQTRMYPCIGNYFEWAIKDQHTMKFKKYNPLPVFLSRMLVVTLCESWWPFLFIFCAFPLASMFGEIRGVFTICCFLLLNNSCYIALGAVFGTLMPTVSLGMIGATLFGQTTVITAGFFTLLPNAVGWIRYISPIFYTFSGIVKTAYKSTDTYKCVKGNSAVGFNQCFLEQNPAIDHYKTRGINVAAFGDPTSKSVHTEAIMLLVLFSAMQLVMYVYHRIQLSKKLHNTLPSDDDDEEYIQSLVELRRNSLFLTISVPKHLQDSGISDLEESNELPVKKDNSLATSKKTNNDEDRCKKRVSFADDHALSGTSVAISKKTKGSSLSKSVRDEKANASSLISFTAFDAPVESEEEPDM